MTWDIDLVKRLRFYINDIETPYVFTDANLQVFILIAISNVESSLMGIETGGPYVIDIEAVTVSPDPVESAPHTAFLNLIVLAAACILTRADLKKQSIKYGIKIIDDKSTIDTSNVIGSLRDLSKDYCQAYQDGLEDFRMTRGKGCKAILSPFAQGYPRRTVR
jgi:hypothetical protein